MAPLKSKTFDRVVPRISVYALDGAREKVADRRAEPRINRVRDRLWFHRACAAETFGSEQRFRQCRVIGYIDDADLFIWERAARPNSRPSS